MPLEGKIMGTNKKTLASIIVLVLVAGIMFYAGAKYEKNKLSKMGLLKNSPSSQTSTGNKKSKTPSNSTTTPQGNTDTTTTPSDNTGSTTAPQTNSTTPSNTSPSSPSNNTGTSGNSAE